MADRDNSGWWKTLPGVITAVTGLLTAIAGLLVALHQTGLIGGDATQTGVTQGAPAIVAPAPEPPPGPGQLNGKVFKVDGNDRILISQVALGEKKVAFALEVATNITWWKQIKVLDKNGSAIATLETRDAVKGPVVSGAFDVARFGDRVTVEFWKAKFLGAATLVDTRSYATADVTGFRTRYFWENDF